MKTVQSTRFTRSLGCFVAPVAALMLGGVASAQSAAPAYIAAQPQAVAPQYVPSPATLNAAQLDQLTAPIALYPDPLLAEMLPAMTYPTEVTAAAQFVASNGTPAQPLIDQQPWEPSVRALVHYPTVLQMMATQMDWTQQLGAAYLNQPDDVMNSIQRMRSIASGDGALYSSPEQQVVTTDNTISILPVDPDQIYIPDYDPAVVFIPGRHYGHDVVRFDHHYSGGAWLTYNTDWRNHYIVEGTHFDRGRDGHVVPQVTGQRWVRNNAKPLPERAMVRPGAVREDRAVRAPEAPIRDEHARPAAQVEPPAIERRAEPVRPVEPQRVEPRPAEPVRPEAHEVRPEPAHVEAPHEEQHAEPAHAEPAHAEPAHAEPAHAEPAHEDGHDGQDGRH